MCLVFFYWYSQPIASRPLLGLQEPRNRSCEAKKGLLVSSKNMKGQIVGINPSGKFTMIFFKLESGKSAHTYTGEQYRNYAVWSSFKVGDWIDGLEWRAEKKKQINADSPVYLA